MQVSLFLQAPDIAVIRFRSALLDVPRARKGPRGDVRDVGHVPLARSCRCTKPGRSKGEHCPPSVLLPVSERMRLESVYYAKSGQKAVPALDRANLVKPLVLLVKVYLDARGRFVGTYHTRVHSLVRMAILFT